MSEKAPAPSRSSIPLAPAALILLAMLIVLGVWILNYARSMDSSVHVAGSVHERPVQSRDVTMEVRDKLADNSLSIIASNELFGDPAGGIVKALRVDYAVDGTAGVRWVREGETLKIIPPPGKALEIRQAMYGDLPMEHDQPVPGDTGIGSTANDATDVTQRIQNLIKNDQVTIEASNTVMGGDPAFGKTKQLTLTYTVGGTEHTLTANEGKTFHLPYNSDGTGPLAILRATWGAQQ